MYGFLDAVIVLLAFILNPIAKKKRAQESSKSPEGGALVLNDLPLPNLTASSIPPTPATEASWGAPVHPHDWEKEVQGVGSMPPTPADDWGPMDVPGSAEAATSATGYFDTPSTLQRRSSFASAASMPRPPFGMTGLTAMTPARPSIDAESKVSSPSRALIALADEFNSLTTQAQN